MTRLLYILILLVPTISWGQTVTNAITQNRTSGMVPLCVVFEASGTTSGESNEPFHDLKYEWTFDDAGSGTWPHSGLSRNEENGPVASHCWETAGSYTVTLTTTDRTGGTDVDTVAITAYALDDDTNGCTDAEIFCYANTASTFQGCPLDTDEDGDCENEVANCQVVAAGTAIADDINADSTNNTCHLLARGDNWTDTTAININNLSGPGIIGAFGTGAKPYIVNNTSNHVTYSGSTDWRLVDLDLENTNDSGGNDALSGSSCPTDDLTILRVEMTDTANCIEMNCNQSGDSDRNDGVVMQDNTCSMLDRAVSWAVFVDGIYVADVGWTLETNENSGGGLRRSMHLENAKLAHNLIDGATTGGTDNWAIRTCQGSLGQWCDTEIPSQHIVFSDNTSYITNSGTHMFMSPGDTFGNGNDVIIERNLWLSNGNVASGAIRGGNNSCFTDVTWRNNIINCDDPGGGSNNTCEIMQTSAGGGSCSVNNQWLYNNTIFADDTVVNNARTGVLSQGTGHICRNNLLHVPNGPAGRTGDCTAGTNSNNIDDLDYTGVPFVSATGDRDTRAEFALDSAGTVTGTDPVDGGFDFSSDIDEHVYIDAQADSTRPNGTDWDVGADEEGMDSEPTTGVIIPVLAWLLKALGFKAS